MSYIDGFVLAVPRANLDAYRALAQAAAEVWREHGALAVVEAVGDDVPYGKRTSFPRAVQATEDEAVVLSWILHASRETRDATNARVMRDPRITAVMDRMPFDGTRLIFGGFAPIVEV